MIGRTVSHYRIVDQIGAGGMGVVYAAEDDRLGRHVALKFVPEDLAKDALAVERLRSEARTASGLNHPNICTIYDIDEFEGRPFIAMELLRGQTLRDRLTHGPLKVHEAVELGIQVADALESAHNRDIIHRDIKPANLFLGERGHVKILDFGLAKLVTPEHTALTTAGPTRDQTAEGVTLGTVAYMSPEQITGELLDGRTDLFSLGVVLYECLTGHQPFTGKTSAVVFTAILSQAPAAPVLFAPDLPLRLQEVLNNCLEKDRDLRYPNAAGLRADLRRIKRDLESGRSGVFRTASASSSRPVQPSQSLPAIEPAPGSGSAAMREASGGQRQTSDHGVAQPARSNAMLVGVGAAVVAAAIAVLGVVVWRDRRPPDAPSPSAASPPAASASSQVAASLRSQVAVATASLEAKDYRKALATAQEILQTTPNDPDALRVRGAAQSMLKRLDDQLARARELLAAGDAENATNALNAARAIDPDAPAVGELWARAVSQLRTQADVARREAQTRATAGSNAGRGGSQRPSPEPPRVDPPRPPAPEPARPAAPTATESPAVHVAQPTSPPPPVIPPPVTPAPSPAPAQARPAPPDAATPPVQPAPKPTEPAVEHRDPPPARSSESDDAAIRRLVATYARAIESKDIALFRSVKPNLSTDEQRRIEEGFRAVTSQQVAITILSIDVRGQEATVRLERRDTIEAGGRRQTTTGQQAITMMRTGTNWVIREIGR